jgi:hypothetical protein
MRHFDAGTGLAEPRSMTFAISPKSPHFALLIGMFALAGACELDDARPPNDVPSDCYSPFQNLDDAYADDAEGCACEDTATNRAGHCVDGAALMCMQGKWQSVVDGPCEPRLPITSEACIASGGEPHLPDASRAHACPAPLAKVGELTDGEEEIGACCKPIPLGPTECVAIGGEALPDAGNENPFAARCPDGRQLLGTINGQDDGICCAP